MDPTAGVVNLDRRRWWQLWGAAGAARPHLSSLLQFPDSAALSRFPRTTFVVTAACRTLPLVISGGAPAIRCDPGVVSR